MRKLAKLIIIPVLIGVIVELTTHLISQQFKGFFNMDQYSQQNIVINGSTALSSTNAKDLQIKNRTDSTNKSQPEEATDSNEVIIKEGETFADKDSGIVIAVKNIYRNSVDINFTSSQESSHTKWIDLGDVITTENKGYLYKVIFKEISGGNYYIKITFTKEEINSPVPAESKSVLDTIVGKYEGTCTGFNDVDGIEIDIYLTDKDTAEAKLYFIGDTVIPSLQPIACLMKTEYDSANKTLLLTGYQWINAYNGLLVDLKCKLDNKTLSGDIFAGSNFPAQDAGKKIGDFTAVKK
ncbi:hypothetical protein CLHUN_23030 [Ruminiclostridium hungatei]|uniref:Uncharacterized protein n=1 Tax=Ruminiclostridium hungatei TaxID=48256 RepID=A0A1V4SIV0_RUMHU|nr:hypothetical protein [Ruminiclostridium hungatei]OPX43822.1 hypothetical protein CLHUN_23030 [Ruminiclostridium hungatei]